MKQGSVILVDKWRTAGKRINKRSRQHSSEYTAAKDSRIIFMCLGVIHDDTPEDELDPNELLMALGWTPPRQDGSHE